MENHVCDTHCFLDYKDRIIERIERKLELHRIRDQTLPSPEDCARTIGALYAFKLLWNAEGKCKLCDRMCKLHDWQAYDPDQFSFDRINDYRSHNQHNIQITCYRCNINKAAKMYNKQPTDFNKLHKPVIRLREKIFSDE
jgi:hypothetical protein